MRVERSAHVKGHLKALETDVLRAQKTYNELTTERNKREILLNRLKDTYNFLSVMDKGVQSNERVMELTEQLKKAQELIASEAAMTETLEHMKTDRRKLIAQRALPTVPMQQKLKSVTALNEGRAGNVTKAKLEVKTQMMRIKDLQQDFIKQKNSHSGLIDSVFEQHSYKKEFEELSSEHRTQQLLRARLNNKETALTQLGVSLAAVTSHENRQREVAEQQAVLDRMEATIDTMTKAAKTDSPEGILQYWSFLKESGEYLKSTAQSLEDRISEAKVQLGLTRRELDMEVAVSSNHGELPTTLTAMEEEERMANHTLETQHAKVRDR